MARRRGVTAGNGGVGQTPSRAASATGLAQKGKNTVVIAFDIGLRPLDRSLGCARRGGYEFVNVLQGAAPR
ncbi:septum site-determining protein minD, partial [Klebsiella pneumoniae]|nr:septum site-determining protein minD [Klebsiella pneumoniae]